MFRQLILDELETGTKATEELYAAARLRQPGDCSGPICTHRHSQSDMEWQHELRREQQRLKAEGLIQLSDHRWSLVRSG